MSALKHDLFNIFKTLSSASNIDFEVTDVNGQTVEDLARLVWKIYDTCYILLFFRNSKKNRKYLDYIPGTTEFRLRVTEKKLEAMNREECPVRYIFSHGFPC